MQVAAQIIGVICILFGIFYVPIARRHVRETGAVMQATVFQFNILPFILGIALIIYGKL